MITTRLRSCAQGMLIVLALLPAASCAHEENHWTYSGASGPDHWGELSPEFAACASGQSQSPIDVVSPTDVQLDPLETHYGGRSTAIVNNGHTVQVSVEPGNWLLADGKQWNLVQFHFHSPSEHRVQGERFPLEAHFVHSGEAGELLVLAVLFRDGAADAGLSTMWANLPASPEQNEPLALSMREIGLVPDALSYYRYDGSLTTPPCTEGVRWYVLQTPRSVSREQVSAMVRILGENARPPQALHTRRVAY